MPTNQTENYQLSQWAKSDQVKMEDFNADNAKIDGAIKALEGAISGLSAQIPEIVTGSYTGTGTAERFLNLGFTPKAVFIITSYGAVFDSSNGSHTCYGGLALPGLPVVTGGHTCLEIKAGGVGLYHWTEYTSTFNKAYTTNAKNGIYYYVALK